jgi:hypothetical protein
VAELTPLSSQRNDAVYQPISGYAIAAATIAGMFALALLAIAVQAVFLRRAAMMWELLMLPLIGIVLAVVARIQIKQSEGTRTGLKLASLAWWICILGGAGYAAYVYANEFFIDRESAAFADTFFDDLKNDRPRHAFLALVSPLDRSRGNPDNPADFDVQFEEQYPLFRNHELVRLLIRSGKEAKVEHVAVQDITQEAGGFETTHLYRIRTPEGSYESRVRVVALEDKRGGKPQWRIPMNPAPAISVKAEYLSPYGRILQDMGSEANGYLQAWLLHLIGGRDTLTHLMTTPTEFREAKEKEIIGVAMLVGGPATRTSLTTKFLPPDRQALREAEIYGRALWTGGTSIPLAERELAFDDLNDLGFFKKDDANTPFTPNEMDRLRGYWQNLQIRPYIAEAPSAGIKPPEVTQPIVTDKSLSYVIPVLLYVDPFTFAYGYVTVTATGPEFLEVMAKAKAKGDIKDDGSVTPGQLPPRNWRITSFKSDLVPKAVPKRPGGPG